MRSNLAQALGQAVTRCFEPGSDLDAHAAISTVMTSEFQGQYLMHYGDKSSKIMALDACKAVGDGEANAGAIVLVDEGEDCTTAAEFASQLREIQGTLALPETEDNWEKISRAIQKFAALTRGGATKLDPEFVTAIKANYKPITNSMVSERGRLSGVALDLVSSFAPRLGARFEPLVPIIIPALVKVLSRPNKVFVNRGQACLLLIIEHCHLPSIVPHLREAVKDKSQTLRLAAIEATLHVLEHFDKSLLDVREGTSSIQIRHRGNAEDIESIVKDTARDANPTVRQVSRKVFEKYSEMWPERVETFTTPFSPTIRKYLNINSNVATSNGAKPVAALKVKPVSQAPPAGASASTVPAGPSRPMRPKHPGSERPPSNPPSRPGSRLERHEPVPPVPPTSSGASSGSRSDLHSRTAHYVARRGDAVMQPPEDRVTARPASRAAVARDYAPPTVSATSVVSRPASRAQHLGSTKSSEQVPTVPVRAPPSRPPPVCVMPVANADRDPAPSSASSSSTFVRVQRPKPETGLSKGPVRPAQGPVRAVSMKDPPLRPVRSQPIPVQDQEKLRPKPRPLIDLRRHATPPREDPPYPTTAPEVASNTPAISDVATKVPLPESRPGSALDTQSPLELNDPEPPVPSPLTSSAVSSSAASVTAKPAGVSEPKIVSNGGADQGPSRPESVAAVITPAPLVSSVSSSSASASTAKRPAVLNRRGAAPPPGQTQGFAPTRRRGGVNEPTLAQMARQKPSVRKPEVTAAPAAPAAKKAPESAPTVKKMPSSLNTRKETAQTKKPAAPSKTGPSSVKPGANRPPVPKDVPKEVVVAMQVPLPPEESSLPADDDDHDSVKEAPPVSTTPEPPLDATPQASRVPRSTTPVASPVASKGDLLVDLDQTIILSRRSTPPSAQGPSSATADNLMDFDVSVVLPDDFAPMPATHASFPVLRDHHAIATHTPPPAGKPLTVRAIKDPYDSEGESEARVALMEKELNILRA
ncbi:hypothetical protein FRC04_004411 [Tulasnella sp. 424]|nr:hypothetical protein FRC04_004411 [Tulasnella sp. 424]